MTLRVFDTEGGAWVERPPRTVHGRHTGILLLTAGRRDALIAVRDEVSVLRRDVPGVRGELEVPSNAGDLRKTAVVESYGVLLMGNRLGVCVLPDQGGESRGTDDR